MEEKKIKLFTRFRSRYSSVINDLLKKINIASEPNGMLH